MIYTWYFRGYQLFCRIVSVPNFKRKISMTNPCLTSHGNMVTKVLCLTVSSPHSLPLLNLPFSSTVLCAILIIYVYPFLVSYPWP